MLEYGQAYHRPYIRWLLVRTTTWPWPDVEQTTISCLRLHRYWARRRRSGQKLPGTALRPSESALQNPYRCTRIINSRILVLSVMTKFQFGRNYSQRLGLSTGFYIMLGERTRNLRHIWKG
jgi:hypothetical protein